MASLEKLVKAFETLKVFQPGVPPEDTGSATKWVSSELWSYFIFKFGVGDGMFSYEKWKINPPVQENILGAAYMKRLTNITRQLLAEKKLYVEYLSLDTDWLHGYNVHIKIDMFVVYMEHQGRWIRMFCLLKSDTIVQSPWWNLGAPRYDTSRYDTDLDTTSMVGRQPS